MSRPPTTPTCVARPTISEEKRPMLLQPLLDQLSALGLTGCRTALEAQQHNSQYAELTFEDRLGLLLEVECTRRADQRL